MQELQNAIRPRNPVELDSSAPDKVAVSNTVDPNKLLDLSTAKTFKAPLPDANPTPGKGKGINQRAFELGELAASQGGDIDPDRLLLLKNSMVETYEGPTTSTKVKTNPNSPHTVMADELKQAQAEATGIPFAEKNANSMEFAQRSSNASPQAVAIAEGNSIPLSDTQKNAMASNLINVIDMADRQFIRPREALVVANVQSTPETVSDTFQQIKDFAARQKREAQTTHSLSA